MDVSEMKQSLVMSHRILSKTGSMGDVTGHVMVRGPGEDEMLVRCRSRSDMGPALVEETALFKCNLEGEPVEDTGEYTIPPERFIASEMFKARPEVNAVVHGHPPAQILCGITGVEIRPILGCGNWGGFLLALDGVPVFPRSILVASPHVGRAMVDVLGLKNAVLLKGHGNVVVGRTIEEATVRAIQLENMAKVCWDVAAAGMRADDIPGDDIREFLTPTQEAASQGDLTASATQWLWWHYERAVKENVPLYVEMGVAH
jgi:ribulose-5-phosphate 4-epimerase/fuculose-1-phosphate aldolase